MLGFLGVEANDQNARFFDKSCKCQRCGKCCKGEIFPADQQGIIIFPQELERLVIESGLSKKKFKERFTYTKDGQRFLRLPCIFYKEGSVCSIYRYRPLACREFPLNQVVPKNGKKWMTVNMDCPAGKELGDKYAVKVQV